MSEVDTSAEAVERMAKLIAMHGDDQDTAALSALLVERDAARAAAVRADIVCDQQHDEIERLRAECQRLAGEVSRAHKDALGWMERAAAVNAEIKRLRAEVARCEASLLAWIEAVGECNKDRNRLRAALLALTIREEANARREGLDPCHEAQEARALLEEGR